MTDVSPATKPYDEADAESIELSSGEFQFVRTPVLTAVANRRGDSFGSGVETQLELLSYMRSRSSQVAAPAAATTLNLVWRLMAATAISVAIASIGVLLMVVAFTAGSVAPNPFVALAVFSVGLVLLATLLKVIRGSSNPDA